MYVSMTLVSPEKSHKTSEPNLIITPYFSAISRKEYLRMELIENLYQMLTATLKYKGGRFGCYYNLLEFENVNKNCVHDVLHSYFLYPRLAVTFNPRWLFFDGC